MMDDATGMRYVVSTTIHEDLDLGLRGLYENGLEAEIIPYHLEAGVGRDVYSIHLPYQGVELTSPDRSVRERGIEVMKEWLRAYAGHAQVAVLHIEDWPTDGVPYEEKKESFKECAREILPVARECGIDIAIENVLYVEGQSRSFTRPEEVRELVDELARDGYEAYVCLDVGHAYIGARANDIPIGQYFDVLGDRVIHVHMHENDGWTDQHLPVEGRYPEEVYRFVMELPNLRALDIEMNDTFSVEDAVASREYLERFLHPARDGSGPG